MLQIVSRIRPACALFELKELSKSPKARYRKEAVQAGDSFKADDESLLIDACNQLGYYVNVMTAANIEFCVPSCRSRTFVVAVRVQMLAYSQKDVDSDDARPDMPVCYGFFRPLIQTDTYKVDENCVDGPDMSVTHTPVVDDTFLVQEPAWVGEHLECYQAKSLDYPPTTAVCCDMQHLERRTRECTHYHDMTTMQSLSPNSELLVDLTLPLGKQIDVATHMLEHSASIPNIMADSKIWAVKRKRFMHM